MIGLFCLLLTAILLFPLAGFASGIDVTALSDADLELLYDAVLSERIARKKCKSFLVEKGEYRIGIDVPAGAFMVVHEGSSYIANIDVYELPKDRFSFFSGQVACEGEGLSTSHEIGRLVLPDGGVLKVTSGSARFFAVAGGVTFD
jgi:hypothetical protein